MAEIGPLTLRMVLFAVILVVVAASAYINPDRKGQFAPAFVWVLAYLTIHVLALMRGALGGHAVNEALADLQPTTFWLAAPFFAMAATDRRLVGRTEGLVIAAALVMALAYLIAISAVSAGYLSPYALWEAASESGEFFFRNDLLFFYKGNLYFGIAIIFLIAGRVDHPWVLTLLIVALALTLTRGFILAGLTTTLLMFAVQRRWRHIGAVGLGMAVLVLAMQWVLGAQSEPVLGDRAESDSVRIGDFRFILETMSPLTLLIGEGFGSPINGRQNIEISYLWFLWKGGILMLGFWLAPLAAATLQFIRIARDSVDYRLACGFYFSIVYIYIQTATNPFLNNPIGLSFVMIGLFALGTLARHGQVRRPQPEESMRSVPLGANRP